jgi:hypothetical protein
MDKQVFQYFGCAKQYVQMSLYLTSNCNCGVWLSNSQLGQSWLMTQIGIAREGSYDFGMFGKRPKLNKYAKRRQTICGLADVTHTEICRDPVPHLDLGGGCQLRFILKAHFHTSKEGALKVNCHLEPSRLGWFSKSEVGHVKGEMI